MIGLKEFDMKLMRLSIRIPLGLTIADTILGIVIFSKIHSQTGTLPTPLFIIWIISLVILVGITIWSVFDFTGLRKQK